MKTNLLEHASLTLLVSLVSLCGYAQGTLVYDQQSSTEGNNGEGTYGIQSNQPMGQSFTPMFSSVGFIRLRLLDGNFGGIGASVYVNLRENSIGGNLLASSSEVSMTNGFVGYTDFLFSTPVAVTPGTTYFFQPVLQSGDPWSVAGHNGFGYAGGTAFLNGQSLAAIDLWFREGIVVPEPGTWALLLVGCGVLAWHWRKFR